MQELNFLSEKFSPAVLPEVYAPRCELLTLFDRAAKNRFIYVSAPAGSGKTLSTLLWMRKCRRHNIWIGLDKYDSAPSVFYKQLATGIYSTQPDNQGMKRVLTDPTFSASPVEHTIQLISEILPDDRLYTIVLDDLHLIQSGEVIKSLPSIIRRLPRSFVTIILSRHKIPQDFEILLARDKSNVITPQHLRFSEAEIKHYFTSLGKPLTPKECHYAYTATEGWAIGINAIAQSGQVNLGVSGHVFEQYFESQVWNTWKPYLRDFCLSTSVVDEFDPELASTLSGRDDADEIMEHLSVTNSFLSRLGDNVYRYHHLFQDFLRERVISSKLDVTALYKQAANYYKSKKDYSRALRFWLDSGDYKGTDDFLYLFLFENNKGVIAEYADFLRTFFVKDFPEKAFKEAPVLHVLSAWYYYLTSNHEKFEQHMDAIYRNLPRIALFDSKFAEFAILAYSVDHRTPMITKIKQFNRFGKFVRTFTTGGLATNIASFSHNMPYMHRSNQDYSDLSLEQDSMQKLSKTFGQLLGKEWNYIQFGLPACYDYEQNKLETALIKNNHALECFKEDNSVEGLICMLTFQHSVLWRMHKRDDAAQTLSRLQNLVKTSAQFFIPNLSAYEARLKLWDGDKSAAHIWLDNYFVIDTDHVELFRSYQHFTTARAYLSLGDTKKALQYITLLKNFGKNLRRPLDEAEATALLAMLYWAEGKKKQAASELEAAMEILYPFRFIRVFCDEGATILPILKRVLSKVSSADYTGNLDRGYVNEALLGAHAFSKHHKGLMISTKEKQERDIIPLVKLSKQQRHVLELLSRGYRNNEICQITGLKLPTVKTHTSLAYKKLGVNNSMDAVLKARDLELIK